MVMFPYEPYMTSNGWHKLCQLFKLSQSEIGEGFKQTWFGHMVVKILCTPTLKSIDCPPPSNFAMWQIPKCWHRRL